MNSRTSISRIMNRDVVSTRTECALAPVVELMMRCGLAEISVVDHDHALLGTVTRACLLEPKPCSDSVEEFLAREQRRASVTAELDRGFRLSVDASATVADVMNRRFVAVRADATMKEAAALMLENRVSQLPVIGGLGELLGTISAIDLVGALN